MEKKSSKIIPYESLELLGVNKKDLKESDTEALLNGRKTELMNFTVEDTPERRKILERESVGFQKESTFYSSTNAFKDIDPLKKIEEKTLNEFLKNFSSGQNFIQDNTLMTLNSIRVMRDYAKLYYESKDGKEYNIYLEDFIKKTKSNEISFSIENRSLNFEGKVQLQKYITVDDNQENRDILKKSNIDFDELKGNKLKFNSNSLRKLAIGVAVLVSPVTAIALMLVPKRTQIKNDIGLSKDDINQLKKGSIIGTKNDKNERFLVQLDKDTNNLVKVRSNDISIPNKVAGQTLSPIQKEQLKNGKEIHIKDKQGQTIYAKIDLNKKTGLSLKDENGQEIIITPEQTSNKKLSTDKDRLQHIANNGVDGIKDIHPNNTELRKEFLNKYNLSKEVQRSNEIKTLSPEEYNKRGADLNKEIDKLNNSLKSKAGAELSNLKNENTVKADKQEAGFKMKM